MSKIIRLFSFLLTMMMSGLLASTMLSHYNVQCRCSYPKVIIHHSPQQLLAHVHTTFPSFQAGVTRTTTNVQCTCIILATLLCHRLCSFRANFLHSLDSIVTLSLFAALFTNVHSSNTAEHLCSAK